MTQPRRTPWGAYARIADTLRQRITNGDYAPGRLIPSEYALCREFGVTRNTVRRALAVLENEGLISTTHGVGRTVSPAQSDASARVPHPLYRQIANDLQALITNGTYKAGDTLPSEKQLAAQRHISRATARLALQHLESNGLINTIHGKGRFVRQDVPKHPPVVRERPPQAT